MDFSGFQIGVICNRADMKDTAFFFNVRLHFTEIRVSIWVKFQTNQIRNEHFISSILIVFSHFGIGGGGNLKRHSSFRQFFFQNHNFCPVVGIFKIIKHSSDFWNRAWSSDPQTEISGRSRKGIDVPRHIQSALIVTIRMGQTLKAQKLLGFGDDFHMLIRVTNISIIDF